VDPRLSLDDVKRKFLTIPGLELRPLGRQAVDSLYTDYAIQAATYIKEIKLYLCVFSLSRFKIKYRKIRVKVHKLISLDLICFLSL
jgi:hypothetical protein